MRDIDLYVFCGLFVAECYYEFNIKKQKRKIYNDAVIVYCGNMFLYYSVKNIG
jgi:hypothetical protein